ncbi:MAG: hypothetical protein NT154_37725 [Verrucomicrobia bacterium]|nr:hypothetical protein [Verrucomicrobiota bacterium]
MNFETEKLSRKRHRSWLLLLFVLVAVVALVIERWRGQWALKGWKRHAEANGETLDARRVWPRPTARSLEFSNQLAQALDRLPPRLANYSGMLTAIVQEQPGQCRRGSHEPFPPMGQRTSSTNTWQDLNDLIGQARPAFDSLHRLMQDPPSGTDYDMMDWLKTGSIPNFVNVRRGAQALHAAAMNDLHNGNLAGAMEHLEALLGFVRLHADDPSLVSFMIRVAITGLSIDVCWDALQASGWSEEQLAALQGASQFPETLAHMPRVMEAEMVDRLYDLEWLRSHSYEEWVGRYEPIYQSWGAKVPAREAQGLLRLWRQWAFHPLWRLAWADQEELHYARTVEQDLAILKDATQRRSWINLAHQMDVTHRGYRPPAARWRFYGGLPLVDSFSEMVGGSAVAASAYPYPDFSRAWLTAMKNLTLNQMVNAAIALKRHQLRHGRSPGTLAALVPEFLPETPMDFMDGQPLRYRLRTNGSFTLYSVGEDGVDDGGDSTNLVVKKGVGKVGPWEASDWIWPQVAVPRR